MADYTVKRVRDMEAAFGGGLKKVRAELGVESFGIGMLRFPPDSDRYPEHDHAQGDRQEEVYVVLEGSGFIELDGERVAIDPQTLVRVGPGVRRKLVSGPQGMRILALGGTPGEVYDPPDWSKLGDLGTIPSSGS
jgi:mannose-6-phosphate isomerase-like protein (cupin superfamily)